MGGFSIPISAQSPLDSVQHLHPVEVRARRQIGRVENLLTSVQTLQAADLQKFHPQQVAEALKQFAGVNVKDYGGVGGMKTVSVRSLGAAHTAVSYDGILLSDAQIRQNTLYQEELERNLRQVESYVANGVGNQADLDAVKISRLKAQQSRIQYETTRRAYVEMLARLIGEEIAPDAEFVKPMPSPSPAGRVNRPELLLYDSQIANLQAQDKSVVSGLMPKLGLFFTGGYGKPGLNMLEDEFAAYYVAGLKLSWNLGGFYTRRTSKRQLREGIRGVELQRETFLFNLDIDRAQKNNEITRYVEQLRYDDEIVALRTAVKEASAAKMANGTLSGTDFMRDVNAQQMAEQEKIFHEIELLLSIYDLKYITNN